MTTISFAIIPTQHSYTVKTILLSIELGLQIAVMAIGTSGEQDDRWIWVQLVIFGLFGMQRRYVGMEGGWWIIGFFHNVLASLFAGMVWLMIVFGFRVYDDFLGSLAFLLPLGVFYFMGMTDLGWRTFIGFLVLVAMAAGFLLFLRVNDLDQTQCALIVGAFFMGIHIYDWVFDGIVWWRQKAQIEG